MKGARKALLSVLSSLQYLASQGLAIRGHYDDAESNLRQLLELRANDIPELQSWLRRSRYKWLSPEIFIEILEMMAHDVLSALTNEVREAGHYAVIMDEMTDISVKEQVSICFRIVKDNFELQELFCGLYNAADTKATTLFAILKDIVCRFNQPIDMCRGQCYDGAANMRGQRNGLQALMQQEEPRAFYVHCMAHVLNLVLQDLSHKVDMCRDFLSVISELISFVTSSPKRVGLFEALQMEDETVSLRKFCPTRWTLRAASLRSVLLNYKELMVFFSDLVYDERNDAGAKANGFLKVLSKFDTYFMLKLLALIFSRLEMVNTALQKHTLTFDRTEKMITGVKDSLSELREGFAPFWNKTCAEAGEFHIDEPSSPTRRKTPRRYDSGSVGHIYTSSEDMYRQRFYEAVDVVLSSLDERYPLSTWKHMAHIERFLTGIGDSEYLCQFYGNDFEPRHLVLHRDMLIDIAKQCNIPTGTFQDAVQLFAGASGEELRALIPEVAKLVKIALTIPVTSCASERSFSCLRRIKTYLRSTMGQARLNHIVLLHGHKDLTCKININRIANDFIK